MIEILMRNLRSNPVLMTAFVLVSMYLLVSALAPVIALQDPNAQHLFDALRTPSWAYPLGSDEYGRDLLSRLIFGTRSSMIVGVSVALLSAAIGTSLGLAAGFVGGFLDNLLMRLSDIMMSFPSLVLALGLIAALGPGIRNTVLALTLALSPVYARIVRGTVLSVKEEAYIEAARAIGVSKTRIVLRHVLPNIAAPVLVQGALTFGFAVLSEAGLSFVGLGVPPPTASYGNIIASGRDYIFQAPWIVTSSGLAIVVIVLSLLIIADAIRDVVDPYQHRL